MSDVPPDLKVGAIFDRWVGELGRPLALLRLASVIEDHRGHGLIRRVSMVDGALVFTERDPFAKLPTTRKHSRRS